MSGEKVRRLYYVTDACIGCKLCYSRCPVKCIDITVRPVVIDSLSCRGCGNCAEICPKQAVRCMVRPGDAERHVDISSMDGVAKRDDLPRCPVETTLMMISDKWTVLILRDLMQGTVRFNEIRRSLDITPKVLTEKLRRMEANGLVVRTETEDDPPKVEYSLSDLGWSLAPIMDAMWDWGMGYQRLARGAE